MTCANILFLCEDNALLSQLAEAYLNAEAGDRVRGFSAGPKPSGKLNPMLEPALGEQGLSHAGMAPKAWELFALPHAPTPHVVVSLSTGLTRFDSPGWQGRPLTTLWQVEHPHAQTPSFQSLRDSFRRIRLAIDRALAVRMFELQARSVLCRAG